MTTTHLYSNLEELLAIRFHVKHRRLARQQQLVSQKGGLHQAVRKGRGMEFHEVREYVPGDDIRHIDWKVTARTSQVHTKLYSEETERPVVCLIEQSPVMFFGSQIRFKAAQAMNTAAALSWTTFQQGDRLGGMVFNAKDYHWVEPKHQKQAVLKLLRFGLELQQQLKKPDTFDSGWTQHLQQMQTSLKPGSRIFLIGDFLNVDDLFFEQLSLLKKHSELVLIHIYDPIEKHLPSRGLLKISNGHRTLNIFSSQPKQVKQYEAAYDQAWQKLSHWCHKIHIPLTEVSTHENPVDALKKQTILR